MSINLAAIGTFVNSKLVPAFNAIMTQIPVLLSSNETDVQAAIVAVTKVLSDLQSDWNALVAAVKTAG